MSSTFAIAPIPSTLPAPGHLHLILGHFGLDPFYLEIPLDVIERNAVNGVKWLQFLAVYLTGILDGHLTLDGQQQSSPTTSDDPRLEQQQLWRFVVPNNQDPLGEQGIDLEAAGARSSSRTQTSARTPFKELVMQREMNCAFSGARGDMGCEAMHIVPHRIGDNWLDLLWDTRAWDTAGETRPRSIDALENGFLVSASIHAAYEKCKLAIIATPNKVLGTDDVPPRRERTFPFHVPTGMEYPDNQLRYTLQWMGASDQVISANNVDAAFNSDRLEDIEMPSPALVNYSYAYRALQAFGKTNAKYRSRPGVKRPPPPSPPRLGPSRTVNNRLTMLKKRAASQAAAASPPAAQSPPSPAPLPGAGSELADDDLLSIADDGTPPTSFEPRSELELSVHPEGYGGLGEGGRVDAAYIMAMLMHQTPEAKLAKSARLASIEHWRSEVSANGD